MTFPFGFDDDDYFERRARELREADPIHTEIIAEVAAGRRGKKLVLSLCEAGTTWLELALWSTTYDAGQTLKERGRANLRISEIDALIDALHAARDRLEKAGEP